MIIYVAEKTKKESKRVKYLQERLKEKIKMDTILYYPKFPLGKDKWNKLPAINAWYFMLTNRLKSIAQGQSPNRRTLKP